MTGAVLLIPFFLVRVGLLSLLSGEAAAGRAAHFAPVEGWERGAYWVYQISTAGLILSLFFLDIRLEPPVSYTHLTLPTIYSV